MALIDPTQRRLTRSTLPAEADLSSTPVKGPGNLPPTTSNFGVQAGPSTLASGLTQGASAVPKVRPAEMLASPYDLVIVGGGDAGCTAATKAAQAGLRVLVLEAGQNVNPLVSQVPVMHVAASEDPGLAPRELFVRHNAELARDLRDPATAAHFVDAVLAADPTQHAAYVEVVMGILRQAPTLVPGLKEVLARRGGPVAAEGRPLAEQIAADPGANATLIRKLSEQQDPAQRVALLPDHLAREVGHRKKMVARVLGGGTMLNAMITVPGDDDDYRAKQKLFGDDWAPAKMRARFDELVQKTPAVYQYLHKACRALGITTLERLIPGHGGLVEISHANPFLALADPTLRRVVFSQVKNAFRELGDNAGEKLRRAIALGDAADPKVQNTPGIARLPQAVSWDGVRSTPRAALLEAQAKFPGKITIRTGVEAKELLINDDAQCTGVRIKNERGEVEEVHARREVMNAVGAIGSAQLLLNSGLGPAEDLKALGIPVKKDLNVGRNLGGRREITVVFQLKEPIRALKDVQLKTDDSDPHFREWLTKGTGLYANNGVLIAEQVRTMAGKKDPDCVNFILPGGDFRRYESGYSRNVFNPQRLSVAILMENKGESVGEVKLNPKDRFGAPLVNHNFDKEKDEGANIEAMAQQVERVRAQAQRWGVVAEEVWPGAQVTGAALRQFIRECQWDHHPCNTTPQGSASDPGAVVGGAYEVHGIQYLRQIDASVQDKTGLFMWAPTAVGAIHAVEYAVRDAQAEDQRQPGNALVNLQAEEAKRRRR